MSSDLTLTRALELLRYDPATGFFTWLSDRGSVRQGAVAGCRTEKGYVRIRLERQMYKAHRLAWFFAHGVWPTEEVDHCNGVRSDNRIDNLRLASRKLNAQNQREPHFGKSSSQHLGVFWCKGRLKWQARVHVGRRNVHVGYFDVEATAHAAYLDAKRALHAGCLI